MNTDLQERAEPLANGANLPMPSLPEPEAPITFEDCEAAFAADLPTTRYDFDMFGLPCFVEVRGMDDDALGRYESKLVGPITIDPNTKKVLPTKMELNSPDLELDLLCSSVVGFALATKTRGKDGEAPELTCTHDPRSGREVLNTGARRDIFRRLAPVFRRKLLAAARKANGMDPFGWVGAGGR